MKTITLLCALFAFLLLAVSTVLPAAGQSIVFVDINGPAPDLKKQAFVGMFVVNDPTGIDILRYRVEDADEGVVQIGDKDVNLGGFPSKQFVIPFAELKEEHKYTIKVYGFYRGAALARAGEGLGNQNPAEKLVLASKEFMYQPQKEPEFGFTINFVNVEPESGRIVLNLTAPAAFDVLTYEGYIVDESGQQVGPVEKDLYGGPEVVTPMPAKMRAARAEGEYKVTLRLTTRDDKKAEQTYAFRYKPPVPDGLLTRIGDALKTNPAITGLIVVVIAALAVAVILTSRRRTPHIPDIRPPQNPLTMANIGPVRRSRAQLRIVQSPGAARGHEYTLTRFPTIVGRSDKADIRVIDPLVSGRHLEIALQDSIFYVSDLNSKNGTWVNDMRLPANVRKQIGGAVSVRLGEDTYLDLETGV